MVIHNMENCRDALKKYMNNTYRVVLSWLEINAHHASINLSVTCRLAQSQVWEMDNRFHALTGVPCASENPALP